MTSAVLAGSTGLVGSHILSNLLSHPAISSVHAFTRRELPEKSERLHPITSTDTSTWPSSFPPFPAPKLFLSALGTTRAAAGGFEKQRKIDHYLNVELARAAKAAGAEVYVLISSSGANSSSSITYSKMKGETEDEVQKLGFKHCVILRPGLIVGSRNERRTAEAVVRGIATLAGKVNERWLKDGWAQDANVIARAAVNAGLQCVKGERKEEGLWMLAQADIVRLGRTEWKES